MDTFLKDLGEFLSSIAYTIGAGFYYIYSLFSEWIKNIFSNINIPMLPSRSKILYHTYISGTIFLLFLAYVIYINLKAYNLFIKDKKYAVEKRSRIRESDLFKLCFLGGALGGFLGMRHARHKTKKPAFVIIIGILLFIQTLIFSFICGFFGFWIYLS